MFITFEAGEGAGKSTQARRLAETLRGMSIPVVLTREPGGSSVAEDLRNLVVQGDPGRMDAETELLIFTAARRDHIKTVIQPALDAGKIVICDRYIGSTIALQGSAGVALDSIETLHSLFCNNLMPDLTLYLETDDQKAMLRALERVSADGSGESRFERKGADFHTLVNQSFLDQARSLPFWHRVDGDGDIETVAERVLEAVLQHPTFTRIKKTG